MIFSRLHEGCKTVVLHLTGGGDSKLTGVARGFRIGGKIAKQQGYKALAQGPTYC